MAANTPYGARCRQRLNSLRVVAGFQCPSGGRIWVSTEVISAADRKEASEADDERRQHYTITPLGRKVARAQALQFAALARAAVAGGLVPEGAA